ncbi:MULTISPECIES: UDP-4-amino-4,6-dideoxy-N-acetyl-beta-L-altrosamine transaminase [unclassified Alteromonas]|uniref:UDP-4-amino-4, 6-dideoxy-N-acetyl-beta-L-altrosamine transaminase n=1 Tax=unclassified Alteromonas TaxID=2614992 RepID=UPI000509D9F9|nr:MULTISPECIES: UDP-4-amino-4,6-dideoxy-N-acetyl-beta-L-altrosamine transaminase [unclassified Alteromonas]
MIPYGKQHIDGEDIKAVVETLKSDWLTQGPAVPRFEQALAQYCNAQYAVAVNSATSALHLACLALSVGEGDTVWTSPNSFVASSNCALYCNAKVDFVDVDLLTGNMCVSALEDKLEKAAQNNTLPKVVIPVHFAGQSCDMKRIFALSSHYGFRIIEDASHAVGAQYENNFVGSCEYSDICVFSFHPVKIITTMEGGMAMTNDPALADSMRLGRSHGVTNDKALMTEPSHGPWYYQQVSLGYNYRMNDIEGALGVSQVKKLSLFIEKRNAIAKKYDELFKSCPRIHPLIVSDQSYSSYHLYVVRVLDISQEQKKTLIERLRNEGIFAHLHYIPIHTQPYYDALGFNAGDFPNAEQYYQQAITLPIFPDLSSSQVEFIADKLITLLDKLGK